MVQDTLSEYVRKQIGEGMKKADIKERLLAVGWTEDEADASYAEALRRSGIPVPDAGARGSYVKKSSALEVILNFFSFILLGIIATALGTLFFEVIAKYFPDSLSPESSRISSGSIHYAIAALSIAFPMYFFAMRLWFAKFREDEGKVESKLTKWVTYLVLLGVSITIVGDLIATLFTFLQGEMSVRFFLKALTVLSVAGGVFGFYFLERRAIQYRQKVPRSVFQRFGYGLFGIIVLGITLGFLVVGSPATERMRSFDTKRGDDLVNISECIDRYGAKYQRLPEILSDLERSGGSSGYYCSADAVDPETGTPYVYRIVVPSRIVGNVTEAEYELCADFSLSSIGTAIVNGESGYAPYGSNRWAQHASGRVCKTQTTVLETVNVTQEKNPL